MSMVIAMTLLSAVVLLPLIWRVIAIRRPLKVATGGASFESPFRRWKLTHVTGTLLASSTVPITYGSGGVYGSSASGNVTGTVRIYTDVHETMRLRTPGGTETNVEVVNYGVTAQAGDVVSVWNARKGARQFTIAALNHTTGAQMINQQDIYNILQPRQTVFILYVIASMFPVLFFGVFGGAGLPILLWLVLLALYVVGQKRVQRNYSKSGMAEIWNISRAEAGQLSSL